MNINATLFGELIVVLALFMAVICYYLGRRKTETPFLVSLIGFFTAIIPPIALIYLIVLVFKRDLSTTQSNV
ncbi:hypothetical protein [Aliiglaciecola sp. NS0011-25]|uniref:hypothetical protein n=1 Tax=Aliiglaciecola sp. NS0011-25 TaxID=3127654 RepID=UPI003107F225